ncbi:MAG: hypothetical protein ACRDO8_08065, partial [Nocardioidaceae bacterium]
TNKQGVPWVSLMLAFVVGLIFFLPFPSWQGLVGFITSATVLSFGSGPLVLAAMRRQLPDHKRPFKVPGGDIIPFLAFYSANLIIFWTGWEVNLKIGVCVLIGYVLWPFFHKFSKGRAPKIEWRAGATWVLPWVIGELVFSFLSPYKGGMDVISLGWGFLVNLVWSALIFAIALRVRLTPRQAEEYAAVTVEEAAEEDEELGAAAH